jgi:hypothetical protein
MTSVELVAFSNDNHIDTHGAYRGTLSNPRDRLLSTLKKLGLRSPNVLPEHVYTVPISGIYMVQHMNMSSGQRDMQMTRFNAGDIVQIDPACKVMIHRLGS